LPGPVLQPAPAPPNAPARPLQARTFLKLDWRSFSEACVAHLGQHRLRVLLLAWSDAAALQAWHTQVVAAW
jgi:hypothetical protein